MKTVSAVAKLIPRPPARVDNRNPKISEPGVLKRSMAACRSDPVIVPSRRSYLMEET